MFSPAVILQQSVYQSPCLFLIGVFLTTLPVQAEDVFKLINAGDAAVARGDSSAAVSAYSRAIELDPKQQLAYTKRAAVYVAQHKHSLAVRDLDHALSLDSSSVPVLMKRGQLHLQLCNFAAAERDFAAVLAVKPDHKSTKASMASLQQGKASLARAQKLLEANNIQETDKELTKVFRVSTDCLAARLMSARMFLAEGKVEEAIAETGRILKMDPANEDALLMRGQSYYLMEEFDMAKRHYGEILTKYNPDHKEAKQHFTKLKTLQRRLNNVASSVKARQWAEVETDTSELLNEVEERLRTIRADMWMHLATARYHLKRSDDDIVEAADSVLHYGYKNEAVALKARAFIRAERWEAAIQVLETAMNEHGRAEQLMALLQEAQKGLKISKQKDYYKILGVSRDVDDRTLKKVYRRLALQHHPDKVEGDQAKAAAEKKFAEINEAYEILSNPEKRALHDAGEDPNDPNAGQGGGGFHFHGGFPGGFGGFHHGGFHQGGHTFHFQT